MDVINIKDIPKLLSVLENIEKVYSSFSTSLPSNLSQTINNEKKTEAQRLNYFILSF